MTFKASSVIPSQALEDAKAEALRVKSVAANAKAKLLTGASSDDILGLLKILTARKDALQQLASTPNIAQYAKDQEGDQGYDPSSEFTSLIDTLTAVTTNIVNTFPKDPSGHLLGWTLSAENKPTPRVFPSSDTIVLRSKLQDIIDQVS